MNFLTKTPVEFDMQHEGGIEFLKRGMVGWIERRRISDDI